VGRLGGGAPRGHCEHEHLGSRLARGSARSRHRGAGGIRTPAKILDFLAKVRAYPFTSAGGIVDDHLGLDTSLQTHAYPPVTVVIVIIEAFALRTVPAPVEPRRRADVHPTRITVRVGLDWLSMQLIPAICEDGVIGRYQAARIRVRIEMIPGAPGGSDRHHSTFRTHSGRRS
jgi:hypothetical protein